MAFYSRNVLVSLHKSWKLINSSLGEPPLSSHVWQTIKSLGIFAPRRGQRGGEHLRQRNNLKITPIINSERRNFGAFYSEKGVNYNNLLNIQTQDSFKINDARPNPRNLNNLVTIERERIPSATNISSPPTSTSSPKTTKKSRKPASKPALSKNQDNQTTKKKSVLKGMIINCNGLKGTSRFTQFQALLDLHNPDIVLGTESKLDQNIPTYSVFPTNYTVFRKDRNSNGGGVFQAVKSDLICEEHTNYSNESEILWSSLKLYNRKPLYFATCYRPPNSSPDVLEKIQESINKILDSKAHYPNIILGGDLNLGDIDWVSEVPCAINSSNTAQHTRLLQLVDDCSFTQHVKSPTRPASGKTLDLLFSSYPNSVSNISTTSGMSDHLIVLFDIITKPTRSFKPPHKTYVYKRTNWSELSDSILLSSDAFFNSRPQEHSVNENWITFKTSLLKAINDHIPQKMSGSKYKLPWITVAIKRQMRKKDRLHKLAMKTRNQHHWDAFKKQRNLVSKLVKESHSQYLNDVIGDALIDNPKKFWSYVRTSKTESIGIPPLRSGNKFCTADKDKAEALSSHFTSVFTHENLPPPSMDHSSYKSISDLFITSQGVANQLAQLNPNKACGPDELPARILKELAPSIAPWLCYILQQSYTEGTLPLDWTKALVSAIYKKDGKSNPANYRPISLTCLCCKIMEHIVLSHIAKHLSTNNILIDQQHGFRRHFSCETQLISVINDWAKGLNQRVQTDVILLDFSKAFDSVPHQRLINKLNYYGIQGKTATWINAFLSNRTQVVSVNGTHSAPKVVVSGVPQGSVLGPVLFLLYINDITTDINSNLRLFADDSVIYREINNYQDHILLQRDLDKLNIWAKLWQLNFNISKCYHIGITKKQAPSSHTYFLDGKAISATNSTKYLGIIITNNLSWNQHCNAITSKANSTLGLLKRILGECTPEIKSRAYTSLVRPQLEYSSSVWNPYTKRNINKIEMVQHRAVRFVENDYSRLSHITPMLNKLGWETLENRRLLAQLTMFYKINQGLVGLNFPPEVSPLYRRQISRLPNSLSYNNIQTNINTYKYSFYPRTVPTWNNIPFTTENITSLRAFKEETMSFIRSS